MRTTPSAENTPPTSTELDVSILPNAVRPFGSTQSTPEVFRYFHLSSKKLAVRFEDELKRWGSLEDL